jgi:hypothetical protein
MKLLLRPGAVLIAAGSFSALSLAACGGGSTPTPTNSGLPSPMQTPIVTLQNALLNTNDFQSGAVALSPTAVPDLTGAKCSPSQAAGTQYQYKSEIQAASGRVYGNVLVGFDSAANAHAFVTQFYTATQSCHDASGPPVQDTFGTYSFYFSISASPSNLDVEVLQVDKYVSVIIQYLPSGGASNVQSVRDLTNESLMKLKTVNA